ncbi:MAG: hypothetical protein Kow00120_00460 [Anaerolineae bacterium]
MVRCAACGHRFDAMSQVKRGEDIVEQVLAHPRIRALSESQRAFLHDMPPEFLGGDRRLGVTDMSTWANLTVPGVQYHVRRLTHSGVIIPEPKRAGGRYHVYRFAFPNGNIAV